MFWSSDAGKRPALLFKTSQRRRSGSRIGRSCYEASHELFEAVDRFCNRAGTVAAHLRRVLRLGAVDAMVTNADLLLPEVLLAFRRQNPSVTIDLAAAGPEELERQLVAGSRDVLVMPCTNRRSELDYLPMMEEKQSLYCARGHPLFEVPDSAITNGILADHAFVARGYLHQFDLKRIGHHGAEATVEMMEAQLILILSGGFIGYLPAHYAEAWVERGELRALKDAHYSYRSTFYVVTQRGGGENPLVARFRAVIFAASPQARRQGGVGVSA